jgi:hypothetical protein
MTRTPDNAFFARAVTIHRYDCEAVPASHGTDAATTRDGPAEGLPDRSEAVAAYAVSARPVYDGIRRLIGHVAGLLVLVEAGGRRDVLDLPDLPAARERWRELEGRLHAIGVPHGLEAHFERLGTAHAAIGEVLNEFAAARRQRQWQHHINRAGERITFAYSCLQSASEPRAGMTPVDFNHACCSCAQRWLQEGGNNGSVFNMGA